jgi:hypothetical protein
MVRSALLEFIGDDDLFVSDPHHTKASLGGEAYEAFGAMLRVNTSIKLDLPTFDNAVSDERVMEHFNQMRIGPRETIGVEPDAKRRLGQCLARVERTKRRRPFRGQLLVQLAPIEPISLLVGSERYYQFRSINPCFPWSFPSYLLEISFRVYSRRLNSTVAYTMHTTDKM